MAATANLFVSFMKHALAGEIEWKLNSTKIKAFLYSDLLGASIDQNSMDFVVDADPVSNQSFAAGVTEQTLDFSGGAGVTQVDSTLIPLAGAILKFDAPDIVFPGITSDVTDNSANSVRYLVLYQWNTSIADSILIGYCNFGENLDLVEQNLTIQWNADGIIKITYDTPNV